MSIPAKKGVIPARLYRITFAFLTLLTLLTLLTIMDVLGHYGTGDPALERESLTEKESIIGQTAIMGQRCQYRPSGSYYNF